MNSVEEFNRHRTLLFYIAYRMLGSATDAEDIVQEAFLRWQQVSPDEVKSAKSYLSTIVTRLCIDQLRSARAEREVYVGPWLPEPVFTSQWADVTSNADLEESISIAFLVVLESLGPVERAVFLLREVFGYEYVEIAQIVGKSAANCRQMNRRAQQRIEERRPRFRTTREQRERVTHEFLKACNEGNLSKLMALMTDNVVLLSDGGGKVRAAVNPVIGASNSARFILGVLAKAPPGMSVQVKEVNGQTSFITYVGETATGAVTLDIVGEQIRGVYIVVNPDKLQALQEEGESIPTPEAIDGA